MSDPLLQRLLPRRRWWWVLTGLPLPFLPYSLFVPPATGEQVEFPWLLAVLVLGFAGAIWAAQMAPSALIRGFAYAFWSICLSLAFGAGMLKAVVNQWGLARGQGPLWLSLSFGLGSGLCAFGLLMLGALILTEPALRLSPKARDRRV